MNIRTGSGYIKLERGYDPIGASLVTSEDLVVKCGPLEVALHLGVFNIVRVNGAVVETDPMNGPGRIFQDLTGYTPGQLHRWAKKLPCSCGERRKDEGEGILGERLQVCPTCGRVLNSELHTSNW